MTTIESEYTRLKALADAATPGPWFYGIAYEEERGPVPFTYESPGYYDNTGIIGGKTTVVGCDEYKVFNSPADAEFLTSAHDMMALIERLMQERRLLRAALTAQHRFRHDLSACGCQGCMDTRALLGVAPVADAGPTPFAGRRTDRTRE